MTNKAGKISSQYDAVNFSAFQSFHLFQSDTFSIKNRQMFSDAYSFLSVNLTEFLGFVSAFPIDVTANDPFFHAGVEFLIPLRLIW